MLGAAAGDHQADVVERLLAVRVRPARRRVDQPPRPATQRPPGSACGQRPPLVPGWPSARPRPSWHRCRRWVAAGRAPRRSRRRRRGGDQPPCDDGPRRRFECTGPTADRGRAGAKPGASESLRRRTKRSPRRRPRVRHRARGLRRGRRAAGRAAGSGSQARFPPHPAGDFELGARSEHRPALTGAARRSKARRRRSRARRAAARAPRPRRPARRERGPKPPLLGVEVAAVEVDRRRRRAPPPPCPAPAPRSSRARRAPRAAGAPPAARHPESSSIAACPWTRARLPGAGAMAQPTIASSSRHRLVPRLRRGCGVAGCGSNSRRRAS